MARQPLRPFWSYYGSRYQLVPSYPRPLYGRIVEPFAGAAAYSLHYHDRQVILNDLDPIVAGIWDYLIRVSEQEILRLPDVLTHVDDLGVVPQEARHLVGFWLGRCRSAPCLLVGSWMKTHAVDRPGCFWGYAVRTRIASQLRFIRHWKISCGSYKDIATDTATYFIDPPFRGSAGRRYRKGSTAIDFEHLGAWCGSRPGQVMVCEQSGADWLPFSAAKIGRGMTGVRETLLWQKTPVGQLALDLTPRSFSGMGG